MQIKNGCNYENFSVIQALTLTDAEDRYLTRRRTKSATAASVEKQLWHTTNIFHVLTTAYRIMLAQNHRTHAYLA